MKRLYRAYNTLVAYMQLMLPLLIISGVISGIISYFNISGSVGTHVNKYVAYDVHWIALLFLWSNVVILIATLANTVSSMVEEYSISWLELGTYIGLAYFVRILPLTILTMAVILIGYHFADIVLNVNALWYILMYSFLLRNVYGVVWIVWQQEGLKLKIAN
jgi:hypothetical protein